MNELYVKESDAPVLSSDDTVAATIDRGQEAIYEINQQRDVENATIAEKFKGFSDTWDSTYLAKSYDYLTHDAKYMFDDLDEEWAKGNTSKVMYERLNKAGIQHKYFRQFADAKSEPHFQAILERVTDTQEAERNIAETLNSYGGLWSERGLSTVATGLLDIDTAVSVGLSFAAKSNNLRKIMYQNTPAVVAGTTTLHSAAAKMAYETDPSLTAGEAVFFAGSSGLLDFAEIKYFQHKKPYEEDIVKGVVDGKTSKDYLDRLATDLDRIRKNKLDDAEYEVYINDFQYLVKKGILTKDEASGLISGLLNKRKMNEAKIKLKADDIGHGFLNIKGSGRKIAIATLVSMGITVDAEGSDGFVVTAAGLGAIALLGAVGFTVARSALKASATYGVADAKKAIGDFMVDIPAKARTVASGVNKALRKKPVNDNIADLNHLRVSLFETTQPLLEAIDRNKNFDGFVARDLVEKMLFNTGDGTIFSMERNRDRMFRSWDNSSLDFMRSNYLEWSKSVPIMSRKNYDTDAGYFIGSRNEFEQLVFNHNTGIKASTNAAVIKASADIDGLYAKMNKELSESRQNFIDNRKGLVQGAEARVQKFLNEAKSAKTKKAAKEATAKADEAMKVVRKLNDQLADAAAIKVTRNHIRSANMNVISTNMDATGYDNLVKVIGDVYNISPEEAKALINTLSNDSRALTFKTPDDIEKNIADMPKDFRRFKEFTYTDLDGNEIPMQLNGLFEINPTASISATSKNLAGQIAMMDAGHTYRSAMNAIDAMVANGIAKTETDAMKDALTLIYGGTILDQSSQFSKLRRDVTNYLIASKLGLSVLSQLPEAFRLLIDKGGLKNLANGVSIMLNKYKYKGILRELIDGTGLAQDSKGLTFGAIDHIGDGNINVQTGRTSRLGNAITKAGERGRDTSLFMMVHSSDLLTKIAMMKNIEWLGELIKGGKLSPDRMKIFGLTDENMAMFKKRGIHKLQEGVDGTLGLDKWTREERLEFYKVMQNMTMKDVQATTIGNSPQWTRTSELGMAMSLLTNFSIGSIANHGIYAAKGAMNGDLLSVGRENLAMFAGGYVAAMLRDTLADKEPNHPKYAVYAIMGLGALQPFDTVKSLADPAIFSDSRKVADAIQSGITPE